MYRWHTLSQIEAGRVIGIIRAGSPQTATQDAIACIDAGITVTEISFHTPQAPSAIHAALTARPSALIGAGTILDTATARTAILAGAKFLICPTVSAAVIATGHRYGIPVIAGAATPTEIQHALTAGADAVKLFPASAYTPNAIKDLLQALPHAPLIPTGGITLPTVAAWIQAGAIAVGIGSALTHGDITGNAARVRDAISTPAST